MAKAWAGAAVTRATRWVLNRDQGICWICGHPGADTCDHIKPRSTHPHLTWDPTNWAAAHGSAQPQYNCPGQYSRGNTPGPRRPNTNTRELHIVIGPPCAGKTTYITQNRTDKEIVIDHDALAQSLGSPNSHPHTGPHTRAARTARKALITWLLENHDAPTAWIIHTAPSATQLLEYTQAAATPHLIDPGKTTCLNRAKQQREPWTTAAIHDWYRNHAQRLRTWTETTTKNTMNTTTTRDW